MMCREDGTYNIEFDDKDIFKEFKVPVSRIRKVSERESEVEVRVRERDYKRKCDGERGRHVNKGWGVLAEVSSEKEEGMERYEGGWKKQKGRMSGELLTTKLAS
jgi:hypothetical protein